MRLFKEPKMLPLRTNSSIPMPKVSTKGNIMPASPIRKLVPFSEAAKNAGKKVYHLNIGQPDIATPKSFINAIQNVDINVLEYSHSAGIPSYRDKLCKYYAEHNINVSPDDIIVTTGGSEAIQIAMMVCFNPGDEVIIPEPFYANFNCFSCAADITLKPVQSTIDKGFSLPLIEEFEKQITPKTRGIMVCNPGNPTGYLYTKEELEKLKELVIKHDLFLFADEVYREFCYDSKEYFSVMHLQGIDNNVVMLDSISKRYSACGARIGTLVSKNKDVMAAAMKFAQARLSPPTLEQIGAEAALDEPLEYTESVKKEYVKRRDYLVEALNNIDGVICPKTSGAFYCIAQLPIDDADIFCQWLLESFDYNNETVMLAPASGFYATPGLGKNQVRIAYVLNVDSLKKAITCLEEGLKSYPGRVTQ